MLSRLGIKFEREKIILNGDRWVLLDFFIPSVNLAIELDGSQHRDQKQYDHGRSMWLARKGIKTVRFGTGMF
jgi:very-short-patch-repair endonuclease